MENFRKILALMMVVATTAFAVSLYPEGATQEAMELKELNNVPITASKNN